MKGMVVTQESEESLAGRAKSGDRSAVEALLDIHRGRLRTWVESRLGPRLRASLEVDDVVQEAQLRAIESVGRFTWRGEGSFFRWLCVIAQHLIWNASKKRSGRDSRLVVEPPGSGVAPSKVMRRRERFDRLEESMRDLSAAEREAVQLSRIEGLRIKEVAKRMKRPEPTVRSLIARALKKLRDSFGDTESLHLPDQNLGTEDGQR